MMKFVLKMIEGCPLEEKVLKMMNFALKMMICVLKMMNFVLKMMICVLKMMI